VRLGGLLHDIGRQALAFFFPQQYERVQKIIETDRRSSYMAELLVFGTEHQTVGSILSARWNFPSYLSNVIGDHHYLAATDWNTLTLPIFCANEYLNERENMPFQQYYQRLEGYFLLKRKDLPWEDTPAAFDAFLQDFQDPFVA
jgi:HD-like signal output (HDOD) protein